MADQRLRALERAAADDPSAAKRLGRERCRAEGHPGHETVIPRLGDVLEEWVDEWGNPGARAFGDKIGYTTIRAQTSDGPRDIAQWWCERCGEQVQEVIEEIACRWRWGCERAIQNRDESLCFDHLLAVQAHEHGQCDGAPRCLICATPDAVDEHGLVFRILRPEVAHGA